MILIGPLGAGKSSTLNSLAGRDCATAASTLSAKSLTERVQQFTSDDYYLIDTPSLSEKLLGEIVNNKDYKDIDMVIFVFPVGRFGTDEIQALRIFNEKWQDFHNKSIILIVKRNETVDIESLKENALFKSVFSSVSSRCLTIDNKHKESKDSRYTINTIKVYAKELSDDDQKRGNGRRVRCVCNIL